MTARIVRGCALLVLAAAWLAAQSSQIAGPVTGYVFDGSNHQLRSILGIPGASVMGNAMDFGITVAAAYVAPRQDAAFVTDADGALHLFGIQSGMASELVMNGLTGAPERVAFSPSGTAAALYRAGSIQVVTGLPNAAMVAGSIDVSAAGILHSIALSDDGTVLLLASASSIGLYSSGGNLGTLTDTAGAALVAFAPGSHDAAVADPLGAGVLSLRDLTGASTSQVVAAPDDTIRSASALAFSTDGQRLLLASFAGQSVTAFDLAAGTRNDIACTCSPTALTRVGDLFRLNDLGHDPLWLLDAQADAPRIVFVPALGGDAHPTRTQIGPIRRPIRPLSRGPLPE